MKPDDTLTAAAIGSLAFISSSMAHEALGHGSICLALGGQILLDPVSMQCTVSTPLLVAAGPLLNVAFGAVLWIILTRARALPVHLRYFLWLTMAFNLFNAAGYFGLGAVTGFGDWGVLLGALNLWWRVGLGLIAAALYYGSMRVVASAGAVFLGRGRRLTLPPYLAAGMVACAAAAFTPLGWSYIWVGAAASFGAGLGLLAIHDWGGSVSVPGSELPLTRHYGWIAVAGGIVAAFVFIVGRGLKLGL